MSTDNTNDQNSLSRRDFIKTTAAVGATASLLASGNYAHAQGSGKIRVGLIGCGGRGTGAAGNCVSSSPNVEIYAMADAFQDRLDSSRKTLMEAAPGMINVTDDRCFVGLDAYKQVLAQPVDMVILATPPGFRPIHFPAAVAAGKHIFMEKPVATDAPGIRAVLAAADEASRKRLCVVAGTQRRHQAGYVDVIKRIHDGAIGDVVAAQIYWNGGGVGNGTGPIPANPTLEWEIRHWYFFTWLSGDHIVEQHVHNIDVANWVFGKHPESALAVGGRAQRTASIYGQIFDHFAVDYTYPNNVHVMSMCRHWDGTPSNVSERFVGTKGNSDAWRNITGASPYKFEGKEINPYVQEHTDLIATIRAGKHVNEARQVAESTLTAIMGRMAAYSGEIVTWDQALNSDVSLRPTPVAFNTPTPMPAPAIPGKAQVG
jgi:myo-inositol 2-dehydrogenase/D-chiro-inositol 1-dehydrogenase